MWENLLNLRSKNPRDLVQKMSSVGFSQSMRVTLNLTQQGWNIISL